MKLAGLLSTMLALGALAPGAGAGEGDVKPRLPGDIHGRAIWVDSKLPVAGATVHVAETSIVATTDGEGYFRIHNVPRGTYTLLIHGPGARRFELRRIQVDWSHSVGIPWLLGVAPCRCDGPKDLIVIAMNDTTRITAMLAGHIEPKLSANDRPYFEEVREIHGPCFGRWKPAPQFWRRMPVRRDIDQFSHLVETRLERGAIIWRQSLPHRLSN